MGLFKNWILKRADKIREADAAVQEAKRAEQLKTYEEQKAFRNTLREEIKKNLEAIATAKEAEPCHIAVGDEVTLNKFSVRVSGNNGWDGGPDTLLRNIPEEEKTSPVTLTITKIYVDTSLAYERLDKYIDWSSEARLRAVGVGGVWEDYRKWLNVNMDKSPHQIWDKCGLYKTAHFEYAGTFKPRWGLNVNSFIKAGTPEFDKTIEIWSREIEVLQKKRQLDAQIAELDADRDKLKAQFANLTNLK